MTKEEVIESIYKDVRKYFETTGNPMPLQFISQWYNRKVRNLKLKTIDFIESDPRLFYMITKKGSRLLMSHDDLKSMQLDGTLFKNYWNSYGVDNF